MSCFVPGPVYLPHSKSGIKWAKNDGDGYLSIGWTQAYSITQPYQLLYNIYFSNTRQDVFKEGIKCISLDGYYCARFADFPLGQTIFWAVQASLYDPTWFNPQLLPAAGPSFSDKLKMYPETTLSLDINNTAITIPITDVTDFPPYGVIQIGAELIQYIGLDTNNGDLLASERGAFGTSARTHQIDGYDGYEQQSPIIKFWTGYAENNETIHEVTNQFVYPIFPYIDQPGDGYRVTQDAINTDFTADYNKQINFVPYDYTGWRRTDPVQLFAGACLGTYIGGEIMCADGYGVGHQLRGVPFNEESSRRLEELLSLDGDYCCLLQRLYTGTTCSCMESTIQNPSLRCKFCYGVGILGGYQQYFWLRNSDGRIRVRFSNADEEIKIDENGLENTFIVNNWTLAVPALKTRDILIRFNEDGTEEFRYRITKINRNRLLASIAGAQKFDVVRLRRTDPVYQFSVFENTEFYPSTIQTGIGLLQSPSGPIPHTHTLTISEQIISPAQINQTTQDTLGHNHEIRAGIAQSVLGHSHSLTL